MARSNYWQRENPIPGFLQNELLRFLEDYLRPEARGGSQAAPTDLEPTGWSPLIDVYETPEETIVVAEVPGVDPTKVELSITGNLLVLRGVKEAGGTPGTPTPGPGKKVRLVPAADHGLQRCGL